MNNLLEKLREQIIKDYPKDTIKVELMLNSNGWQVKKTQGKGTNLKGE